MPKQARKLFWKGIAHTVVRDGQHILIALSGGADSVALLRLFGEIADRKQLSLSACHVNHGIRGAEAARDENFCQELCNSLKIPFYCVSIDVPSQAKAQKQGIEETARELRYQALSKVAKKASCDLIATAHNADDHLETVLFHLARGSGSRGMQGIAPLRENIIRPLLFCTKDEIIHYLAAIGQAYVTDSTNEDTNYTRNYIRQTIMPAMRKLNPEAARASLNMSTALREDEAYITAHLPEFYPCLSELSAMPSPLLYRVLAQEYKRVGGVGAAREHYEALIALIRNGKTGDCISLPGNITARREKTQLAFFSTTRNGAQIDVLTEKHPILRETDNVSSPIPHIGMISLEEAKKVYNLSIKTAISSAILNSELFWRFRLPGDTIRFGGMTRQVKKLLWQTGLSPKERDRLPIACDENGPLWIPGFPVRDDRKPQGSESECLFLVYIPSQNK